MRGLWANDHQPQWPCVALGCLYISLAIPAIVIEMGGIHRWCTVRGMVEDPIAQIFLCLYVV